MEHPLVVGVDGSDGSLTALDWAVDEAVRLHLPLRVVYASLWERYEGPVPSTNGEYLAEEALAERVVASAGQRAGQRAPRLAVETVLAPEDAVEALLAESREAAAVITGASGRGVVKELLLGSVSLAVAGRAHGPAVVVRGEERNLRGECGRVVVGVGAEESAAAVRFALREAEARGCELQAVRAWRFPEQEPLDRMSILDTQTQAHEDRASAALAAALREPHRAHPEVTVRHTTVEGPAHKALVRLSAEADLLVLGAASRHGHRGLHLGRVAHRALHRAACPVAVVPNR
ncbi:nucleotide-binding universal stress UspA family protein [Streptomyces olivoverticillatus]|uniref:Nucleotide-binding universal stress UspA family protein n=1 Tax=Streptomyces olivoverticillatus TaxID=66427 RepID=A0A7W7LNX6_9ACTN|nr:universal stress protein [Streptomyces olivoverticillatus]MBB4893710.1 nucleotide-binding universal stress UspA family protein [Streptomyces olivoverticillatus]